MSAVAWLVNVSLSQKLWSLMTSYSSFFRSTSPECSFPDHLTAPLMILNSIRLMGPQRNIRSAALQRKTRLIVKSLCFMHLYYICTSEFCNLGSPRLLTTRLPSEQCFQHSNQSGFTFVLTSAQMVWRKTIRLLFWLRESPHSEGIHHKPYGQNTPFEIIYNCCAHSTANCASVIRRW